MAKAWKCLSLCLVVPAVALAQGVVRPARPAEQLLLTRHINSGPAGASYNGVVAPPGTIVTITATTTRATAASGVAGTVTFRISDLTNNCDCVANCATAGTDGFGDVGAKRFSCSGVCSFTGGTALYLSTVTSGCGTLPVVQSIDVRGTVK